MKALIRVALMLALLPSVAEAGGSFVYFAIQPCASGAGCAPEVLVYDAATAGPTYGFARSDIDTLFPGYQNTGRAVGFYLIDTTTLTNGIHTIAWVVHDNTGAAQGIGSRYFFVENP